MYSWQNGSVHEAEDRPPPRRYENVDAADHRSYIRETQHQTSSLERDSQPKQENVVVTRPRYQNEAKPAGDFEDDFENLSIGMDSSPVAELPTTEAAPKPGRWRRRVEESSRLSTVTSSSVEFDDDSISDDEDDVARKVGFHRSEIKKLLTEEEYDIDIDKLGVHLSAVIEKYKVKDDVQELVFLSTLYLHNGDPVSYRRILQDFKFDGNFGPIQNLSAYLLRAKAAYNLGDFDAAYKDARRVISLAKRYPDNPEVESFENCAVVMAASCAEYMGDEDDALYYRSLWHEDMLPPTVVMGSEVTPIFIEPRRIPPFLIDGSEEGADGEESLGGKPFLRAPDRSLGRGDNIDGGQEDLPLHKKKPPGKKEELCHVYLKDDSPLSVPQATILRDTLVDLSRTTRPFGETDPKWRPSLGFIVPEQAADVLEIAVIQDERLAERLFRAEQSTFTGTPDNVYDLGHFASIRAYPDWLPREYIDKIYNRLHLLAVLGTSQKGEIHRQYVQQWAGNKFREMASDELNYLHENRGSLYEALTIAAAVGNGAVAQAILEFDPYLASDPPRDAQVASVPITPLALMVIWQGKKANNEYFKSMISSMFEPWRCGLQGMNVFHAAAKFSTSSTDGLERILNRHQCEECLKRRAYDADFEKSLTPYGIIMARFDVATSDEEGSVLVDMATLLSAAGGDVL